MVWPAAAPFFQWAGANANWLAPVGFGIWNTLTGKNQARRENETNEANFDAQQRAYDYALSKEELPVAGARELLSYYGSADDPFSPFVGRTATGSGIAQNVGGSYLSNVLPYQQAGLRGVQGVQGLADTSSAQDTLALANEYANPFLQQTYDRGVQSINTQTGDQARQDAIASASRGSALSGQAARLAGAREGARSGAIGNLATQVGSQAFNQGIDRARQQQQYQLGLANQLTGLGSTGLNQAVTGQNLLSTAGQTGINSAFAPFTAYNAAVPGLGGVPQVPQAQPYQSPWATGLGAGILGFGSVWDPLNPQQQQ